jgi:hypothetical protein
VKIGKSLEFGEWHTGDTFGVAVDAVEQRGMTDVFAFSTPDGKVATPHGQQFVVAFLRLKNLRQSPQEPLLGWFGFLADGTVESVGGTVDHPAYRNGLDLDWLELADETPRYSTVSGDPIESGDIVERWVGALLPAAVDLDDVAVTYAAESRVAGESVNAVASWSG